jgi:serine/threonine protein kinase
VENMKKQMEKLEKERVDEEKRLLDEIERLKLEKQQLKEQSKQPSHVFVSTPNMQQLPTYLNEETLEVSTDEYSIIEEIGEGGSASVYKGIHTKSRRDVVIKKIDNAAANANNKKMFASEVTKIRFLVHPGTPKVEAYYRIDKDMCVVFQQSNGLSVRYVMDENSTTNKVPETVPSLLPSDLLRLTVRLIEILDYVHSIGVIHYDIKPENVLLCNSDYGVQLIDFGSAGFVSITNTTRNLTTAVYSSPENLNLFALDNLRSDKRAMTKLDVWSLGATLLNACCSAQLLTDFYNDNDSIRPYFSVTYLGNGQIMLDDDHKIAWDLELVLSKYFEVCSEAKAVWDSVDNDIKDIIKVCLIHDISKRPFIRDITQMQSYQRLRNKM